MFKVTVINDHQEGRYGPRRHNLRVTETADVKELDGNLIVFGCAFDYERITNGGLGGVTPQVIKRHQAARVTVIPRGEWTRVDIEPVTD